MARAGPAVVSNDSIDGQYPPIGRSPASGHSLGSSSATWNGKEVTIQRVIDDGSDPSRLPFSFMVHLSNDVSRTGPLEDWAKLGLSAHAYV